MTYQNDLLSIKFPLVSNIEYLIFFIKFCEGKVAWSGKSERDGARNCGNIKAGVVVLAAWSSHRSTQTRFEGEPVHHAMLRHGAPRQPVPALLPYIIQQLRHVAPTHADQNLIAMPDAPEIRVLRCVP